MGAVHPVKSFQKLLFWENTTANKFMSRMLGYKELKENFQVIVGLI